MSDVKMVEGGMDRRAKDLWELRDKYAALLARHNALREAVREAVAWERECREYHHLAAVWDELLSTDAYCTDELTASLKAARAEVDRLLQEEN